MKTQTFTLPAHWASYLINGDASGYTDEELHEIDEWMTTNSPGYGLDVGDVEFTWSGDDGWLGADRAEYTFQIIEELVSDGETIGYSL
jgi:hypothetical protein